MDVPADSARAGDPRPPAIAHRGNRSAYRQTASAAGWRGSTARASMAQFRSASTPAMGGSRTIGHAPAGFQHMLPVAHPPAWSGPADPRRNRCDESASASLRNAGPARRAACPAGLARPRCSGSPRHSTRARLLKRLAGAVGAVKHSACKVGACRGEGRTISSLPGATWVRRLSAAPIPRRRGFDVQRRSRAIVERRIVVAAAAAPATARLSRRFSMLPRPASPAAAGS